MKKLLIPVVLIIIAIIGYSAYLVYDLQAVTANGMIKAAQVENIMIDFPAYIKTVYVTEGQRVEADQPLMLLDLSQYRAQIARKEQELRSLQTQLQQETSEVGQLENDLAHAEATFALSRQILRDKEHLYAEGLISRYELDNIRQETRADETRAANLRQALEAKTKGISARQAILDQMDSVRSELEALKNKFNLTCIKDSTVVAPIAGVVCDIGYRGGDVVDDEKKLLSILDDQQLYVEASVPELLIKDITIGSSARFFPVAYDHFLPLANRKEYTGKVTDISRMVVTQGSERVFTVKVALDNPDQYLVPNLSGQVKFFKK